ncbi:thioredoxin family protein [Pseudomonas sp. 2FE]|uniref:thioredoxin family protein n=1 Tax=Pseudomonas sp. 2FE TaxID=2502190 RepID=UPI0010F87D55|nr:thioredoxin family protein [Pseudomonas sp. 2FE]
MKIELLHSPGCARCLAEHEALRGVAEQLVAGMLWREINVLESFDYAVELGVLSLPALAIDGELVFAKLPTPEQLAQELRRRLAQGAAHGT